MSLEIELGLWGSSQREQHGGGRFERKRLVGKLQIAEFLKRTEEHTYLLGVMASKRRVQQTPRAQQPLPRGLSLMLAGTSSPI